MSRSGIVALANGRRAPKQDATMVTATQVADWIVRFRYEEFAVPVDPMSLEKLIYYAQSFHLALTNRELFAEPITAWRRGPVVSSVWDRYRKYDASPIIPQGAGQRVDTSLADFLREIVIFFGNYTAIQLSNATHAEEPWQKARQGFSKTENSNVVIPTDQLKSYYHALVSLGEEALSRHELLDVVPEPRWAYLYVAGICQRKMFGHPLYDPQLAKRLSEKTPELPELGDDFYAPIGKPDYLVFKSKNSAA
jgi:uncharacterized phage-associated protein